MSHAVDANKSQFVGLNTDFGYDALGGVGKTGRLGAHEVEVLKAPEHRQSDRVAGPPKSIGRWFDKLLDAITPSSWRAQGKFKRSLEDYSANLNRALGHLYNTMSAKDDVKEKTASLNLVLKEMATLKDNAKGMTSRGVEYKDVLTERMQLNMQILQNENKALFDSLVQFKAAGDLAGIIDSLDVDTQGDIIADLKLMADSIPDVQQNEVREEGKIAYAFRELKEFIQDNFTLKGRALLELEKNQGILKDLSDEARAELTACLDTIKQAAENLDSCDLDLVRETRSQAMGKMGEATRFAIDSVCQKALENMDKSEVVGQSGISYTNITREQVKKELDSIEAHVIDNAQSTSEGSGTENVSKNPFTMVVQNAKAQIDEISQLYKEAGDNLKALENKKISFDCARAVTEVVSNLEPSEELELMHNTLIDALQSGYIDARERYEFDTDTENAIESFRAILNTAENLDGALVEKARDAFESFAPLRQSQMLSQDRLEQMSLNEKLKLYELDDPNVKLQGIAELKSLHQSISHVGALLNQSGLGQADLITAKALQVSNQIYALETTSLKGSSMILESKIKSMVSNLSTCMAQMALATMQSVNSDAHSSWSKNTNLNKDDVQKACGYMSRALGYLVDRLDSSHGKALAKAAINNGNILAQCAERAALACAALKDKDAAEQLCVCVESSRNDAPHTLESMLNGKKWSDKVSSDINSHKNAIHDFIQAASNLNVTKNQNDLMLFLTNRINRKNIVVHDVYRGFDNGIYMLINTDRQNVTGKSKEVQGSKLVKLPNPESLDSKNIDTGVTRLDEFLNEKSNREDFYPKLYQLLNAHFDGELIDFSL